MCSIDQNIILSEAKNAQFSWCKCCGTYSLFYNNCCVSFSQRQLQDFKQTLNALEPDDYKFCMMNERYVIVKNTNTCVGLCLTAQDTEIVQRLVEKALALQEAFDIIYSPLNPPLYE